MPKLPKGFYRRGKSYYCRFQRGGEDVRRSLGANHDEAVRAFRKLTGAPEQVESMRLLVREALERWIATGVTATRLESGRRDIESRMRRIVVPLLGERRLADVRPDDLFALRVTLEKQGASTARVHRVLSELRTFFRWAAYDARLIAEPPIPRRLLPRLQQSFPERLSDEEVERVSSVAEPYGFIVRFALATGLRWGELTRAQTSDVQRGVLRVAQTKSGKTRIVPLGAEILAALRSRVGRLVPFTHPGMFARRVRERSGVERFHMHLTRHTFACRWVEAGGNLAVLQALLGHSSVLVTQRYGRLSDEAIAVETKRVGMQSGTNQAQSPERASKQHS